MLYVPDISWQKTKMKAAVHRQWGAAQRMHNNFMKVKKKKKCYM